MIPLYPQQKTIILIDIAFKNYSIDFILRQLIINEFIPVCGFCKCSLLKIHDWYTKYYFQELIETLRLRCADCRKTHAVIPSFSFPGTSIGTEEAESVIEMADEKNSSYAITKKVFPEQQESHYVNQLIKKFNSYILNAKAIFTEHGDHSLSGLSWLQSVTEIKERPLFHFNQFCLEQEVNCLFCTHIRFLWIFQNKPGSRISHNSTPTGFP